MCARLNRELESLELRRVHKKASGGSFVCPFSVTQCARLNLSQGLPLPMRRSSRHTGTAYPYDVADKSELDI
jgi:hypothetical protein